MRQRAVQLLDGEEHGRRQEDDLRQELQEGDRGTGGTVSPNYITQQNSDYRHVYTKGRGVTRPTAAQLDIAQRNLAAKRAAQARKEAEEKKEKNEKEMGLWQKIQSSYLMSYSSTSGICASGVAMIGSGGEASLCLLRVGGEYAFSYTPEYVAGPEASLGLSVGLVWSNADAIDQVRGEAAGFAGTVGPFGVSHRGTFGTRNSRGDIVHSYGVDGGAQAGLGYSFGSGSTRIATVRDVASTVWDKLAFWQ